MNQSRMDGIFTKIASEHGISIEDMMQEIENAIEIGITNRDPRVRAFWQKIPSIQEKPTPTEFLDFLVTASL